MDIKDRVVVVTGGGNGIGRALCRRFAEEGARGVAVADLDHEAAQRVAEEIGGLAVACDVAKREENRRLIVQTEERFGPIDLFCANAGIGPGSDPIKTTPEEWKLLWDVHVMAHVHAVGILLPRMLKRGFGYFLHTSSMAGILSSHGNLPYAATKHAAVGLAEWLSFTYGHRGIGVSCLCPLGVKTGLFTMSGPAALAAGDPKEPEEVAEIVVQALAEERFLILTDPLAQEWIERKARDHQRWLRGMGRLQQQIEEA